MVDLSQVKKNYFTLSGGNKKVAICLTQITACIFGALF
jgi:hypothetical protein